MAAVVSIGALYLGRVVFIPFAFALLFSLILTPVVVFLEKIKFQRFVAILLVVLTLLGITCLIGWITSQQFVELSDQLPGYAQTLEKKVHAGHRTRNIRLTRFSETVSELGRELAEAIPGSSPEDTKRNAQSSLGSSAAHPLSVTVVPPGNALESIASMLGPIVNVFVVAIFTMFILVGREDLRDRLIKLVVGGRRLNLMTRALDETTQRINKYLFLQLVVNAGYGLVIGIVLSLIGLPNAALWGMTATVLRFLPYVGPPLAAIMPILISIAVFPGFFHALGIMAFYVVLELVVGNLVEPLVYGAHVGLSPLAILVAAVFWTLIWGFPGLLLSTPLTVCLVVIGRYSPSLAFLNTILGDEPVLPPHAQYYQRLLATDQGEARQILERYRNEHSLEDTYSAILLPALGLAEQDRHRNELDEDARTFIYQSTREFVDELADLSDSSTQASAISTPNFAVNHLARPKVLCIPVRDEADEIAAIILSQLLTKMGFPGSNLPVTTRTAILRQVKTAAPVIVCLSALPPFAMEPARALYGKLRERHTSLRIIVCFWQFEGDIQKMASRLKLTPGDHLLTTLPEVIAQISDHWQTADVEERSEGLAQQQP